MEALERAIIKTLCYFDIFDYPLTPLELWKWLYDDRQQTTDHGQRHYSVADVLQSLSESQYLRERLMTKFGFYFLRGRVEIVETRMDRYRLAELKYHRAIRVIRWLRYLPFVRMIGVCNTLAYSNSRPEGDIDLFIVTAPGRVWQCRFWVAGFLQLFRMRPRPSQRQDTICATFFTDTNHLDLESLCLPGDIYLPYWIVQVVPVYDEGFYHHFVRANDWVSKHLPYRLPIWPPPRRRLKRLHFMRQLIDTFFLIWPELLFKRFEMRVLPMRLKQLANKDSRVVIQDYMLKFHDNDRRAGFLQQWQVRVGEIL